MKVVLDTNVTISGLMYPESVPGKILEACKNGGFEWYSSQFLWDELERVLEYDSVSKIIKKDEAEITRIVFEMKLRSRTIELSGAEVPVPEDPDDLKVIATLVESRADCLVTGDKALLKMSPVLPILIPADFWAKYGS